MAKAAGASLTRGKLLHHLELRLHDRYDDELRDALARLDREGVPPAVPTRDHQLALIVRIDQADQIAEYDAVLMAEPRARKNRCREPGVRNVDGDAGRNQLAVARLERQRRIETGAQIDAGGARGTALGQRNLVADP